jgi:D-lactate dehydrogenase (cytochrome)
VEVVLADGRVMNALSKLRKDNTGYDLKNLIIGSEGMLGVITAATLKMMPRPRLLETAFIAVPSPHAALALFNEASAAAGFALTTFELMSDLALQFSLRHGQNIRSPVNGIYPWYALIELSHGSESADGLLEQILETAIRHDLIADAVVAASEAQRLAFWRVREFMSEAQKFEGGSIKHDISVPVGAVARFLVEATAAAEELVPGARCAPFGHLGDGNIHFNVSQPERADREEFLGRWDEMNDVVHAIVLKLNGSISAEHGIGVLKRDVLPRVKDQASLAMMRAIKHAFDPRNIINPGKLI